MISDKRLDDMLNHKGWFKHDIEKILKEAKESRAYIAKLEAAITTAMLDDEGFVTCDYSYCQDDCNACRYKDLRDITEEIDGR